MYRRRDHSSFAHSPDTPYSVPPKMTPRRDRVIDHSSSSSCRSWPNTRIIRTQAIPPEREEGEEEESDEFLERATTDLRVRNVAFRCFFFCSFLCLVLLYSSLYHKDTNMVRGHDLSSCMIRRSTLEARPAVLRSADSRHNDYAGLQVHSYQTMIRPTPPWHIQSGEVWDPFLPILLGGCSYPL
jgi:hypothetical protein